MECKIANPVREVRKHRYCMSQNAQYASQTNLRTDPASRKQIITSPPERWKMKKEEWGYILASQADHYMMSGWWQMAEGMCTRAGNLRKKLDKDIVSDLRRIEVMEEDGILSDIQDWWRRPLSWVGVENPHSLPRL